MCLTLFNLVLPNLIDVKHFFFGGAGNGSTLANSDLEQESAVFGLGPKSDPTACFCVACELGMVFTFLSGWKEKSRGEHFVTR